MAIERAPGELLHGGLVGERLGPSLRRQLGFQTARVILHDGADLVEMASQHVLHPHKALTQMNVQIRHVISDITGTTGLAIVDAISAGQRDPVAFATLCDAPLPPS